MADAIEGSSLLSRLESRVNLQDPSAFLTCYTGLLNKECVDTNSLASTICIIKFLDAPFFSPAPSQVFSCFILSP